MRPFSTLLLIASLIVAAPAVAEEEAEGKISYFYLKPSLVTNVKGLAKYVRCDVQLMTRSEDELTAIATHAPALRHELLLLLSEQKGERLKTPDGREMFRKEALAATQQVMKTQTGKNSIDDLFFTAFFVQ